MNPSPAETLFQGQTNPIVKLLVFPRLIDSSPSWAGMERCGEEDGLFQIGGAGIGRPPELCPVERFQEIEGADGRIVHASQISCDRRQGCEVAGIILAKVDLRDSPASNVPINAKVCHAPAANGWTSGIGLDAGSLRNRN